MDVGALSDSDSDDDCRWDPDGKTVCRRKKTDGSGYCDEHYGIPPPGRCEWFYQDGVRCKEQADVVFCLNHLDDPIFVEACGISYRGWSTSPITFTDVNSSQIDRIECHFALETSTERRKARKAGIAYKIQSEHEYQMKVVELIKQ